MDISADTFVSYVNGSHWAVILIYCLPTHETSAPAIKVYIYKYRYICIDIYT